MFDRIKAYKDTYLTVLLALGFGFLGFIVQWPYLWDVPRFTDETWEVLKGLAIYTDGIRPLLNNDPYKGAIFNYLMAAGYLLAGPNPYFPRLLVTLFYAATVVVVYFWGNKIGGYRIGALAAGLLALSPSAIIGSSHTAMSNAITPFFVTVTLYFLHPALSPAMETMKAEPKTWGWMLVAAGLAAGIAFQTHPTSIAVLAGCGLAVVAFRRQWFRTRWPYLAAAAFVLGCANLLYHHLLHRLTGMASELPDAYVYAWSESDPLSARSYLIGLANTISTLRAMISGAPPVPYLDWGFGRPFDNAASFVIGVGTSFTGWEMVTTIASQWIFPGLLVVGLLAGWKTGQKMLSIAIVSWLLLLPLYHTQLEYLTRYNAIVLPAMCVATAVGIGHICDLARRHGNRWFPIGLSIVLAGLVSVNLFRLYQAEDQWARRQPSNQNMLRVASIAAGMARRGQTVAVDIAMYRQRPFDETSESRTLDHILAFYRIPRASSEAVTRTSVNRYMGQRGSQLVIAEASKLEALRQWFDVETTKEGETLLASNGGGDIIPIAARLWRKETRIPPNAVYVGETLGGQIELVAYRVEAQTASASQPIRIVIYWRAIAPIQEVYTVSLQVLSIEGDKKIAQRDRPPDSGPTNVWPLGAIIEEEYELALKEGVTPGKATVIAGLYTWPSVTRIPVTAPALNESRDFVPLATIDIE